MEEKEVGIVLTAGLPGSGKSTWSRAWVAEGKKERVRVSRDDLRVMLVGGSDGEKMVLDWESEEVITGMIDLAVREAVKSGKSVVVDATHLRAKHIREMFKLGFELGVDVEIERFDETKGIGIEDCVKRDAERGELGVGEEVIRRLASKFMRGGKVQIPKNDVKEKAEREQEWVDGVEKFDVENHSGADTVIVDIDGTVALMDKSETGRGPFDWKRVGEDTANEVVCALVQTLKDSGLSVVFMSGRSDECWEETVNWLDKVFGWKSEGGEFNLWMRRKGDFRKDSEVKADLFKEMIKQTDARVHFVLDDRDQVVKLWRSMGLTCLQVADGAF